MIRRPVAVVFERLADLPGYRRWMHRTGLFRRCWLTSEAILLVGLLTKIAVLWTIGIIVLVIGLVLLVLGLTGRAVRAANTGY